MFRYDRAVLERYPAIHAGILHLEGLPDAAAPAALGEQYRAAQAEVAQRLAPTPIAALPSIAAWRRAFAGFGAKPTQYRCAAEALLRRLARQSELPSVNALVDIGNLVSIRYALPVAVVDLAGVAAPVTVRFATGDEPFTDLGGGPAGTPEPGEVVFVDREGVACARRWCWRQSAQSATRPGTSEALVIVEALHDGAEDDVAAARAELVALLARFRPAARVTTYGLSARQPAATGVILGSTGPG
ncbi:B3/B4 domain-containing protein [Pseudonocardia sichuanensis]